MEEKIFSFINKWHVLIILLSLILFHGIVNYFWINNNNIYYHPDEYWHLTFSINIHDILFSNKTDVTFLDNQVFYSRPLMPFITAIAIYPLFGTDTNVAIMTNVLFLAVLIFSTYGIGKKLYNKNTGLLAAFLVSMYPIIFGISRFYTYFIGLAAIISLCFLLLLLCDKFKNRKYSILFGLSSGIGMLLNISFVIFMTIPILYVIISSLKIVGKRERCKIISNLAISLLVMFLVAGIWHGYSLLTHNYLGILKMPFNTPVTIIPTPELFNSIGIISEIENKNDIYIYLQILLYFFTYYLNVLINYLVFLPFFILLCIGLFFYTKSKNRNNLLILWLVIPYIIFSILVIKFKAYIIPLLPAIAILSVFWVFRIKNQRLKKYIILSIVIYGIIQFYIISYSTILSNLNLPGFKTASHTNPPEKIDWKEKEILSYIINNSEVYPVKIAYLMPVFPPRLIDVPSFVNTVGNYYSSDSRSILLDSSQKHFFNAMVFTYYPILYDLPIEIYHIQNPSKIDNKIISQTDFLIVKSDYLTIKNMNTSVEIFTTNNFYLVKDFDLPDNTKILIFKNMTSVQ